MNDTENLSLNWLCQKHPTLFSRRVSTTSTLPALMLWWRTEPPSRSRPALIGAPLFSSSSTFTWSTNQNKEHDPPIRKNIEGLVDWKLHLLDFNRNTMLIQFLWTDLWKKLTILTALFWAVVAECSGVVVPDKSHTSVRAPFWKTEKHWGESLQSWKSEPQAKVWHRRVIRPQPRRGAEFPQSRVSRCRSRSRPRLLL